MGHRSLKVIESGTIWKFGYGFLTFPTLTLTLTLGLGDKVIENWNFVKMFDAGKTRIIGLPYGEKTMTIC